jgi:carbon monoxide dehydrogenase subunit G
MATVRRQFTTDAPAAAIWDAIRDIGALHTRLVPGFVIDTRLEPGARLVTFGNGATVREPIVTIDDATMRLVWSAQGGLTTHYNASVQVIAPAEGPRSVVWIADLLPDSAAPAIEAAMTAGAAVMKRTLDALAQRVSPPGP